MKNDEGVNKLILQWCVDHFPEERLKNSKEFKFKGFSSEQIIYHVGQLYRRGFLDVRDASAGQKVNYFIADITPEREDYLQIMNNKSIKSVESILGKFIVVKIPFTICL